MITVLLVEDESHKQEEITRFLKKYFGDELALECAGSVHEAFHAVNNNAYDLLVLDIALPTFSGGKDGAERGHDQAFGGLEVLRALKSIRRRLNVIIITQHPIISIGGASHKVTAVAPVLAKRYEQNVLGGVIYKYKSSSNEAKLIPLFARVR